MPPYPSPPRRLASYTESMQLGWRRLPHLPVSQWLLATVVLAALVAVAIPAISQGADNGAQARVLARAKQIGLALKLFAGDNDGDYPKDGVPTLLHAPATSNAAFAPLFPTYTQSEKIFGNFLSAYETRAPDNVIDTVYTGKPGKTLEPGENVFAYVMGLNDAMNAACPLVVEGTDGTGHYVSDPDKRGGVWGGTAAIVIRLDCSGLVTPLVGPPDARFVPLGGQAEALHGKPDDNLLDVTRLGKGVKLLEPAIAPAN